MDGASFYHLLDFPTRVGSSISQLNYQLRITLAPAASEFDDHFLGFATMEPVGPYLDFRDAAGDLLYTLAPAE